LEAVILAGGLGTRLQKTVPHLPKALAPIQTTPFLTLLLTQIEKSGIFSKVILSLGFKSDQITNYLKTLSFSIPVLALKEPKQLGTGGAILYALEKVANPIFCVLNGDSYSDLCFADFYQFHLDRSAEISIACHEIEDTRRYGTIQYDKTLRISNFSEKIDTIKKGSISRGIYFFNRQVFDGLTLQEYSLEKDLFPIFIKKKMFAYPQTTTFIDIGTEAAYFEAQQLLTPWITK